MSEKRMKLRQRRQAYRRLHGEKKAVSPVVATLILILIAVAAAAALYLWLVVWQGSVTSGIGSPGAQYTVSIGGSTSVYPFDQLAVTQFEQNNSDVVISDNQGGTGAGMIAVCTGQVDIGTASTAETVAGLQTSDGCPATTSIQVFAYDAVDVIVPVANPHGLGNISWDTLTAVYDGATIRTGAAAASLQAPSIDGVGLSTLYGSGVSALASPYISVSGTKYTISQGLQWDQIPACVVGATGCGGSGNPVEAASAATTDSGTLSTITGYSIPALQATIASTATAGSVAATIPAGFVGAAVGATTGTVVATTTWQLVAPQLTANTLVTPSAGSTGFAYTLGGGATCSSVTAAPTTAFGTSLAVPSGGLESVSMTISYTCSVAGTITVTALPLSWAGYTQSYIITGATAAYASPHAGYLSLTGVTTTPSAATDGGVAGVVSAVTAGTGTASIASGTVTSPAFGFTFAPAATDDAGGALVITAASLAYTGTTQTIQVVASSGTASGAVILAADVSGVEESTCGFSVCAGGTGATLATDQIDTVARTEASGTTQTFEARLLDAVSSTSFATTASAIAFTGCGGNNLISDCGMVATKTGQGNPNVITTVAGDLDSIGYASDGYARASTSGVSCQGVPSAACGIGLESVGQPGAVQPSLGSTGTIAIGTILGGFGPAGQTTTKTWTGGSAYGGSRPFEYVTTSTPSGEVARFINFVMDPGNNINLAGESYEVSYYSV